MRIAVTANPHKPLALRLARAAAERLRPAADVLFSQETAVALGSDGPSSPLEALEAEAVVAIGGDGTFLWTLQRIEAPLLPINAGTLGFLAEVDGSEPAAFEGALDRLVRGQYYVDARMKLASQLDRANLPDATNEVVVHTAQVAKMRLFEIAIDGRPVGRIRADGMILATPTGSTSYSLSAAGPIVEPGVEGIVVASLASFPAGPRAVVVDPLRSVGVRLVEPGKDGVVVVDGQNEHLLPGGQSVTVYRAPRRAQFIRFSGSFFHRLGGRRILPWSDEPNVAQEAGRADLPPPAS
jgi:NAD+ kinase